ncbi:MAG: Hsp20/alpha crystallin family protein [Promethearchaeota archaeon]|nr:MAG: Hsp20/alpha crystallin family protein [Candidatus Lokiarchaeota archaeon]
MTNEKQIKDRKREDIEEEEREEQKSRELSIRRESPFSLFQQMDRMLDNMWRGFDDLFWWPFSSRNYRPLSLRITENEPLFRTPLSNITENDNEYEISAEMPGLDKGDLEINISDGSLEINGEISEEKQEEKKGDLVRRECYSSSYYRLFNLPKNIDEEGIEANLDKGLLKITIPKVEPTESANKKIEIK